MDPLLRKIPSLYFILGTSLLKYLYVLIGTCVELTMNENETKTVQRWTGMGLKPLTSLQ
jgi:hypothetical protein